MIFLEFMFKSIWHFVGVGLMLGAIGDFILKMWNRTLRHWNIRKHGYPPSYCDADGDFINVDREDK
jgi:hypothetical protein